MENGNLQRALGTCDCGEIMEIFVEKGRAGERVYYFAHCKTCGRETPKYTTPGGAVMAWNRRIGIGPVKTEEEETETVEEDEDEDKNEDVFAFERDER